MRSSGLCRTGYRIGHTVGVAQKELEYAWASSGVTNLLSEYEQTMCSLTDAQTLNQQQKVENLTLIEELQKKKI
ncbi:hypothetical protein R1flu_019484 [Riccia fluitans]|uniref:ATP synthase CF0 subunit I n=1 Tax=Riccia fluitans TaxID=41844 RepID=A0ABD1ZKC5_9MARC